MLYGIRTYAYYILINPGIETSYLCICDRVNMKHMTSQLKKPTQPNSTRLKVKGKRLKASVGLGEADDEG